MALRLAAQGLNKAQNYFGELYRRWKARLGTPKAITAMAHKLARILWHLFKYREAFNPEVFKKRRKECSARSSPASTIPPPPSASASFPLNNLTHQLIRSRPTACWRTLSQKKQSRLPRASGVGELSANRKGSCRPACHWCLIEPIQELGPVCADPITGGVRDP